MSSHTTAWKESIWFSISSTLDGNKEMSFKQIKRKIMQKRERYQKELTPNKETTSPSEG